MTDKSPITETEQNYCYVRDIDLPSARVRTVFIRLVRPGEVDSEAVHSIGVEDAYVDTDESGRIIGVNLTWSTAPEEDEEDIF